MTKYDSKITLSWPPTLK